MGAVLGSGYSLKSFAEAAFQAYSRGWSASEVFGHLSDSDYLLSGGLVSVSTGASEPLEPSVASPLTTDGDSEAEGSVPPSVAGDGAAVPMEAQRQDVNKQLFSV